jgi:hypothetical protein
MSSDPVSRRRGAPAGQSLARELGGIFLNQLRGALVQRTSIAKPGRAAVTAVEEPPVVAQLMVEIRSDGSHTIARGALNDLRTGESAQVLAEGRTPAELMMSLATSLLALPSTLFSQTDARPGSGSQELPRAGDKRDPAESAATSNADERRR